MNKVFSFFSSNLNEIKICLFIYLTFFSIYVVGGFRPPRGFIDSDICHIRSSHMKSSKLLKNIIIRSCFLNGYALKLINFKLN